MAKIVLDKNQISHSCVNSLSAPPARRTMCKINLSSLIAKRPPRKMHTRIREWPKEYLPMLHWRVKTTQEQSKQIFRVTRLYVVATVRKLEKLKTAKKRLADRKQNLDWGSGSEATLAPLLVSYCSSQSWRCNTITKINKFIWTAVSTRVFNWWSRQNRAGGRTARLFLVVCGRKSTTDIISRKRKF